jgi:hypothetical protein
MNFIDKFIEYINPQIALKRKYAREVLENNFSFDGGSKRDRMSSWYSPSTSVNGSMSGIIQIIRDRSRDLTSSEST